MVPPTSNPELNRLIEEAKRKLASMTDDERRAMFEAQKASWVRGEIGMGSDKDEASYRAIMGHQGKFTVQYMQSGPHPDRFWWWEIHDADGHCVAHCSEKGIADFICDRMNGR